MSKWSPKERHSAIHWIASALGVVFSLCSGVADDLPAPRGSFRELRFSPDGRYVLAQDESEITVLTVQPFAILFRIPAAHADVAEFTPDSRQLAFLRPGMLVHSQRNMFSKSPAHLERWSMADQTRAESTDLPMLRCGTEELSPDGRFVVCVNDEGTLRIFEVASGQTVFEQKRFTRWHVLFGPEKVQGAVLLGDLGFAYISFSTDSRFVVVWGAPGSTLAWDLRNKVALKLNGDLKGLKDHVTLHFAFLTPDRSLITHAWGGKRGFWTAKVVEFPSGKLLSKPIIPIGSFYRSTYPGFVLVRPFGHYDPNVHRTAAANLSTGQVIVSDGALDVFGQHYVAELVNGKEVGLYEIGKGLQTTVVIHGK